MDEIKQTLTDLTALKELLSVPARWTQGALARDAEGRGVRPFNPEACCFSLVGAMWKVIGSEDCTRYHRLRGAFSYKDSLTFYNDKFSYSAVLAMVSTDLEALRQKVA